MFDRQVSAEEETLLRRAGGEVREGMVANLGIGLPQHLPDYLPDGLDVTLHSENGYVGLDRVLEGGTPDDDVIDAGGRSCSLVPGAACFDSVMSFAIVRGGNLDLAVLGAFEVAVNGDLANWKIPGKLTPGMGGGMELAQKANSVLVVARHVDKRGRVKLVPECSLPLTARRCVDTLITERAVFRRREGRMHLASVHPEFTVDEIVSGIDAELPVVEELEEWKIGKDQER